ncbi:hypothetical protein D9M68_660920 [compost metagenome]
MIPITLGLHLRVDSAQRQVLKCSFQCLCKVGGRVRGGQVHRQSTPGQFNRNRCGQCGFPDTAFTHHHDQAMTIGGDLVDQGLESWRVQFNRRTGRCLRALI